MSTGESCTGSRLLFGAGLLEFEISTGDSDEVAGCGGNLKGVEMKASGLRRWVSCENPVSGKL